MLDGLDEEGCLEESGGHVSEKKRRLSVDQVKALEKNFEVENKLEPERKVKLAQELGLQPRQVAVWFQNRRARWKTKQLERDYGVLKANYDALKLNYDSLQHDNEALLKEIRELKSKLNEENTESNISVKQEETIVHETDHQNKATLDRDQESDDKQAAAVAPPTNVTAISLAPAGNISDEPDQELNYDSGVLGISLFPDLKDGSSDSDSSAILNNEDNNNFHNSNNSHSPNAAISSSDGVIIQSQPHQLSINCFEFSKPTYQTQFVKMEEHNFFGDETCNFFSDEQPPSLPWYCSDQWT